MGRAKVMKETAERMGVWSEVQAAGVRWGPWLKWGVSWAWEDG